MNRGVHILVLGLYVLAIVSLTGCITVMPASEPASTPAEVPPSQEFLQATLMEDSFTLASYDEERAQEAGLLSQTGVNYLVSHSTLPINKFGYYISKPFYLVETDYIHVTISSDCPVSLGRCPCPELQETLIVAGLFSPPSTSEINPLSCEVRRVGNNWETQFICYSGHSGMFHLFITHSAAMGFPEELTYSHWCEYTISLWEQPEPMSTTP